MRGTGIIGIIAIAAAGLLSSAACTAQVPDTADAGISGDGELALGSAAADGTGWIEVADGTEVELIPGAQGGFHVWINIAVRGISGELYIERSARRASDGTLVFRGLRQPIEVPPEAADEWWQSPAAAPAFMCPSPIGIQVNDQELVFQVSLYSEDDIELATDQLILLPRCPGGDQSRFCLDICSG